MMWMKLLLCTLLIYAVASERKYNLRVEKLLFKNSSPDYVPYADVSLTAYNETSTLITGTFVLNKTLPTTAWVMFLGYEQSRTGNDYQQYATVNHTVSLCDFLDTDDTVIPEMRLYSNIPEHCPFPVQTYSIKDFPLEGKSLPDTVPGQDRWRFELWAFENNNTASGILGVAMAFVYFEPI